MRTITIGLYSFDELTGADKIAAMDWWQDAGGNTPLSQYEFTKSGELPDETIPHQVVLLP